MAISFFSKLKRVNIYTYARFGVGLIFKMVLTIVKVYERRGRLVLEMNKLKENTNL